MELATEKLVEKKIIDWSKDICPIYKIYYNGARFGLQFEVYIFYETDKGLQANIASGKTELTKIEFLRILQELNCSHELASGVRFEFDSHENVIKNYEGNYFLRLR